MVRIRRIYDPEKPNEGYKVLVDRLWPRGISKDKATWDEWMKETAPSQELRKWFHHDPEKWEQFKQLYKNELAEKQDELRKLKALEKKYEVLTLVYAAKDELHNNAVVLKELILKN